MNTKDKSANSSQPTKAGENAPQSNTTIHQQDISTQGNIPSPLLWRMLQVPGFTKAMTADIRGEWVMLYSHVNGVPMRLYRKVADVATWLGYEVVNGHLNACDTQEFDPVVIDEPAIDPDDTEIMPCPDAADFETLPDLTAPTATPWVSGGIPHLDGLELLNNMRWLGKGNVGFDVSRVDSYFDLKARLSPTQFDEFFRGWHGAGTGIKEPLAEKQAVEKWLDERFIPYSVLDPVTGFPRTLSLIERLEQSERWLIEELVTARNQLEALRANARQDASQAPTTSAAGKSNPDISAHQTGLIYGDEAA